MQSNSYADGLNYVPFLTEPSNTPPSSSRSNYSHSSGRRRRSTLSLPRTNFPAVSKTSTPKTSATALGYYGNYEGDASMFGGLKKPTFQSLIDTDSETELDSCMRDVLEAKRLGFHKNLMPLNTPICLSTTATTLGSHHSAILTESPFKRLCQHYIEMYVPPQRLSQINAVTERVKENRFCCKFYEYLCILLVMLFTCIRYTIIGIIRMHGYTHQLWRGKTILRNVARRLLWWVTLAKYKDFSFFFIILVATPLLFGVALVGLILSAYCSFKELVSHYGGFIRQRLL